MSSGRATRRRCVLSRWVRRTANSSTWSKASAKATRSSLAICKRSAPARRCNHCRPSRSNQDRNSRPRSRHRLSLERSLLALSLVPQRVHFLEARVRRFAALLFEPRLDMGETPFELGVGPAERVFGIDIHMTREVGDHEKEIADLVLDRGLIARVHRAFDLLGLLAQLGKNGTRIVPIETDLARFLLQLDRAG